MRLLQVLNSVYSKYTNLNVVWSGVTRWKSPTLYSILGNTAVRVCEPS